MEEDFQNQQRIRAYQGFLYRVGAGKTGVVSRREYYRYTFRRIEPTAKSH